MAVAVDHTFPDMVREKWTMQKTLEMLAAGSITATAAQRYLERLGEKPLYCKVSQKGAISIYGLQRMPVTLYVEQWDRLLNFGQDIRDFIASKNGELKRKGDAPREIPTDKAEEQTVEVAG